RLMPPEDPAPSVDDPRRPVGRHGDLHRRAGDLLPDIVRPAIDLVPGGAARRAADDPRLVGPADADGLGAAGDEHPGSPIPSPDLALVIDAPRLALGGDRDPRRRAGHPPPRSPAVAVELVALGAGRGAADDPGLLVAPCADIPRAARQSL